VNPAAGKGAARRRLQEITQSFAAFGIREIKQTRQRGDEERLTLEALAEGWTTIAVVGGDGTCGRVAHTIIESGADCALAVIPAGTGNDFAKTLGVTGYGSQQLASLIGAGNTTRIDVGRVDGRHFVNSCGVGFDASVLEASTRVKLLKGDAVYIYAALAQLLTYRGIPISVDGNRGSTEDETLMLTVSNGRFLGGVFRIAPNASVVDGELDVCVIRDATVWQRVRLFGAAMRGTHERLPPVRAFRATSLSLGFPSPPAIELDGELTHAQSRDVKIECVPHALSVVAADGARL
jgi:diacylglycerol kinase (ATP)